jgi:exopolyphosphatase / guanosine-5'-triphosphate,3'-diphosphate pyrophosphatase
MRAAIVDVGSNTARLLVADCWHDRLAAVLERRVFLGLGEEVESYGWISDAKLRETAGCVREQAAEARSLGAHVVDVVVTAPGRQSQNRAELVAALREGARASVRVLSAEEEGRLAFHGVLAGIEKAPTSLVVCDVGGGSTEIVAGTPSGPVWERSIDLGAVRLTHRLELADPPGRAILPTARAETARMFEGITPPLMEAAFVTGGTARALKSVAGRRLGRKQLLRAEQLLAKQSAAMIASQYCIDTRRARSLLAGCLILGEIQQRLAMPLQVAKTGLREGAALELLSELAAA